MPAGRQDCGLVLRSGSYFAASCFVEQQPLRRVAPGIRGFRPGLRETKPAGDHFKLPGCTFMMTDQSSKLIRADVIFGLCGIRSTEIFVRSRGDQYGPPAKPTGLLVTDGITETIVELSSKKVS